MSTHVVITGSTSGIGLGLARAFLSLGCRVTLVGRSQRSVDAALASLPDSPQQAQGVPADVRRRDDLEALWARASSWAPVDIWINNAGIVESKLPFARLPPEQLDAVIGTNLLGMMHGTQVALRGMTAQGHGRIYNMEGLGADGRRAPLMLVYGTSKRGVRYFTRNLREDLEDGPIPVGTLSPGIVVTRLLLGGYRSAAEREEVLPVLNILADRVETVTPWLARQVLADTRGGSDIHWLTRGRIAWRFATAPFRRRQVIFDDDLPPLSAPAASGDGRRS